MKTNKLYNLLQTIGSETTTEEELQSYMCHPITIVYHGELAIVPFTAESYNLLVQLVEPKEE